MRISDWSSDVCSSDDRDDDELLDQLVREVLDRAIDELRTIIDRHHLDAGRQAFPEVGELVLDRGDRFPRILARAQDHHAAGNLALTVQLDRKSTRLNSSH